eukprot:7387065-Prymnesium_polylepis.2
MRRLQSSRALAAALWAAASRSRSIAYAPRSSGCRQLAASSSSSTATSSATTAARTAAKVPTPRTASVVPESRRTASAQSSRAPPAAQSATSLASLASYAPMHGPQRKLTSSTSSPSFTSSPSSAASSGAWSPLASGGSAWAQAAWHSCPQRSHSTAASSAYRSSQEAHLAVGGRPASRSRLRRPTREASLAARLAAGLAVAASLASSTSTSTSTSASASASASPPCMLGRRYRAISPRSSARHFARARLLLIPCARSSTLVPPDMNADMSAP